ncbi:methionyl aminopeptidase [Macrolepiota fuliginosa MF-IS2]|uniref:Methionine aminopeptidase n=1 Tax=Macrolepiota fuliginosa MF-IS2 TaxID=1400762 RepID=A0A9P5XGX2_9AGAR|nr:methionyl aminopeptidase [Macrolepiota fuliginosa MF-IS2]
MFRLPLLTRRAWRTSPLTTCRSISLKPPAYSKKYSVYTTQTPEEPEELEYFGQYSVILPPEPFVFGVSHIKPRAVPENIIRPPYVRNNGLETLEEPDKPESIIELGGDAEARLRAAARLAKKVREFSGSLIGVTTNEIDQAIHEFILSHKAYPSPLRYLGFPRSCCTSVNNVIVHGIPDDRPLEDGDIVNIDITVFLDGYHGDTSQTFLVGNVDQQGRDLVGLTNRALRAGIDACGPGRPFRGIGKAIHDLLPENYSVSSQFSGHGIGTFFHTKPWILHHKNDEPGVMKPGHCFTIEPSIIQGRNPRGWIFPDDWTASTENCARSAQAEHMVLITKTGAEVLTE